MPLLRNSREYCIQSMFLVDFYKQTKDAEISYSEWQTVTHVATTHLVCRLYRIGRTRRCRGQFTGL